MKTKLLEIRDEGTMIPVLCVDMNPDKFSDDYFASLSTNELHRVTTDMTCQYYLLRRVGYQCDGRPNIAITHLRANGDKCWNDPYGWGGRTYSVAHDYIIKHWAELRDGDVVDVQFILGETAAPKLSERVTVPL